MSKTLGASLMTFNCISMDYCVKEVIQSMKEFADEIAIVDAGSDDGTQELIKELADNKTKYMLLNGDEWKCQHGKGKLSSFSNYAHSMLSTDYFVSCQADEVFHESSYEWMRKAIETGNEGFLCRRVNLWRDCFSELKVPLERRPVSDYVIRIAKRGYMSYDDAESLRVPCVTDFSEQLRIVHYGFVRKKEIMPKKIKYMLESVFEMGMDAKADVDIFNPYAYFSDEDLIPFNEHPRIMQNWIKGRP